MNYFTNNDDDGTQIVGKAPAKTSTDALSLNKSTNNTKSAPPAQKKKGKLFEWIDEQDSGWQNNICLCTYAYIYFLQFN